MQSTTHNTAPKAISHNRPLSDVTIVACPDCDLLQRLPDVVSGASVRCPRCNRELWRHREDSLNRTFALSVAAAILFVIANSFPMLGLTAVGRAASSTVIGGAEQLWRDGDQIVAGLVLFAAVIAPGLQIGFMLLIGFACQFGRPAGWVATLMRHHPFTQTWSMIEVMLIGVLVALTKIAEYAKVIPGIALFALGGLILLIAAMQAAFDPREVWDRITWAEARVKPTGASALMEEPA